MKNFSKTIAAISMSLLTVGAMAQSPADFTNTKGIPLPAKVPAFSHNLSSKKVGTPTQQNYLIDNVAGDENINSFATFSAGFSNLFILDINRALTIADSGKNMNLSANNVTSVFDTLWDNNSQGFVGFITPGSMQVDSITCFVHYHNTSGLNDTILLSVNSVTTPGYPGATVYGVDTVVVTPTFFPYNKIDSGQIFTAHLRKPLSIPASARHGWNFDVQMSVIAPKAKDTIGLIFYFQSVNNCAGLNGYYVNEPTSIGVPNGLVNCVNTFQNGMWWYAKKGNGGTNTSLAWPLTSGADQGRYENANEYWAPLATTLLSCCGGCTGDTLQWDVQDVAIFPFVEAIGSDAGINNIAQSGLSIGQNYPNPFNKTTTINYSLTKSSNVTFSIYDITGRVITNTNYGNVAAGQYQINLNANTFSPGIYFYTFNVNGSTVTKKMVITE